MLEPEEFSDDEVAPSFAPSEEDYENYTQTSIAQITVDERNIPKGGGRARFSSDMTRPPPLLVSVADGQPVGEDRPKTPTIEKEEEEEPLYIFEDDTLRKNNISAGHVKRYHLLSKHKTKNASWCHLCSTLVWVGNPGYMCSRCRIVVHRKCLQDLSACGMAHQVLLSDPDKVPKWRRLEFWTGFTVHTRFSRRT